MAKSYISMFYEDFKGKFREFFLHRKKLKALESFGEFTDFEGKRYIPILKNLLADGFLDELEANFLDHQVKKIENEYTKKIEVMFGSAEKAQEAGIDPKFNYLDWAHHTKWFKTHFQKLKSSTRSVRKPQLYLDLDRERRMAHVPLEVLAQSESNKHARV